MPRPMSRKKLEKLKRRSAQMILAGKGDEEIVKETGLSIFRVTGMRGFLKSARGVEWAKTLTSPPYKPSSEETPPLEETEESVEEDEDLRTGSGPAEGGTPPPPAGDVEEVVRRATVREIEVMLSSVVRKVILDWRILGYLDYAKAEHPELPDDYDIADFLVDCVKIAMHKGEGVGIEFVKRRKVD